MDYRELERLAHEYGFQAVAPLNVSTLDVRDEVRDMCAANRCQLYDSSWSCPPGCGTIEACRERIRAYTQGILVQTVGDIEDSLDLEGIEDVERAHKQNFARMQRELRKHYPSLLSLGSGGCRRCEKCSYPSAPCRFPQDMVSSMEAYGLLVLQVCKDNQLKYYYGESKIAFTSCYLLK